MAIKDGGPAFPQSFTRLENGSFLCSYDMPDGAGLSLRDYFAGQALMGIALAMQSSTRQRYVTGHSDGRECATAYAIADAMLAQREKGGGQ